MRGLIFIITLCFPLVCVSQKSVIDQQQIWYRLHVKVPIGTKWQLRQEFDDRNFINPSRQSQFLSRTHLERKLGHGWNVALGFAYFTHAQPQLPQEEFTVRTELRPSFEIAHKNKLGMKWAISNRLWSEARYFENTISELQFLSFRFRYKLELQHKLSSLITLIGFNEIHINVGKNIIYNAFDQNRLGVGAQFHVLKNVAIEPMYINWFQQLNSPNAYFRRDILRLAIEFVLPVKKSSTST